MKIYAQLNENKICVGISQLSGEVIQENMIEITSVDSTLLWKKYENGAWSTGTFEPQSTAPITEFEQLKSQLQTVQSDNANLVTMLVEGGII